MPISFESDSRSKTMRDLRYRPQFYIIMSLKAIKPAHLDRFVTQTKTYPKLAVSQPWLNMKEVAMNKEKVTISLPRG